MANRSIQLVNEIVELTSMELSHVQGGRGIDAILDVPGIAGETGDRESVNGSGILGHVNWYPSTNCR